MSKAKNTKKNPYPNDKYGIKYPDSVGVGAYDVTKAEEMTRPKSPALKIKEPLNLYKKPASIRPEVNDKHLKKFGQSIHVKVDMGSKYETKIIKYPTPRGIDYDALMKATKPRTQGGGFGGP